VELDQIIGIVLAAGLLGVAGLFAWRQKRALVALREQDIQTAADRRYHRNQSRRRIAYCVLMTLCAVMIAGWFVFEDELRRSAEWSVLYWIAVLLLVLAILLLAAFDFWAIARYGLRHHHQIQADRQAMLEVQAARLRQQRNGRS
jgi:hypothetical protein